MNRRSLLLGTAAAAILPPVTILPGRKGAKAAMSSRRGCWASHFDGSTYLRRDGTTPDCPTASPYGLVVYHFRATLPGSGSSNPTIFATNTAAGYSSLAIVHGGVAGGKNGHSPGIFVGLNAGPSPAGPLFSASSSAGAIPYNNAYHSVIVGWDSNAGWIKVKVDRQPLTLTTTSAGGPFSVPYVTGIGGAPLIYMVGNSIAVLGGYKFTGDIAEFKGFFGTPLDSDDPNVLDSLVAPNGGPLPFEHRTRDGYNSYLGLTPQIYLSGGVYFFPYSRQTSQNLGPSGISQRNPSSDPSFFYVAAGALQTAALDPWGFTGV